MPQTFIEGTQKITTHYTLVVATRKREQVEYNALQDGIDQRPDSWRNYEDLK